MSILLPAILLVLLLLAFPFLERREAQRRRRTLEELGAQLGMECDLAPPAAALEPYAGLPLFETGNSRSMAWRVHGHRDGVDLELFEYRHATGHGRGRQLFVHTVVGIPAARPLPVLALHPERLGDRLAALVGAQDIDFPEQPEFSKRYRLTSPQEAALRAAFATSQVFEALERAWQSEVLRHASFRLGRRPCRPSVECSERRLVFYYATSSLNHVEATAMFRDALSVYRALGGH
jgi:hypothetical protein